MKGSIEYSKKEVCAIVLEHHESRFAKVDGLKWKATTMGYMDSVRCELVEESEETPE